MTQTVVDALVVTLGLDPSGFTKGQKEAAESLIKTRDNANAVAKEMAAKGKQAAEFFSTVKNEALGLIGVLLGAQGLDSFIRSTTKSIVEMGNAARNIGMPIGELNAFGMMVERHGGNAAAAAASFQKLTDAANNFAILGGSSQYASVMGMLGLNPGAKGTDVYSALLKYASEHNNARGIQETRTYGQMLGLDEGTLNTLLDQAKGGVAQFHKEMAESVSLGVRTPEMAEAMKQLMHDWNALSQATSHYGDVFLKDAQPYLSAFLKWNTEMIKQTPGTTLAIEGLASAFVAFSSLASLSNLFGLTALAEKLALISRLGIAGAAAYLFYKTVAPHPASGSVELDWERNRMEELSRTNPAPREGWPAGGASPNAPGRADQHGTRQEAIEFFRKQGYSAEQAAAIATTIQFESGYNAAAFNGAGGGRGARGAIQWRGDRIENYRRLFGHDPDQGSYQENLRFIQWELQNTERGANQALRQSHTEAEGVDALNRTYTRPGHPYSILRSKPLAAPSARDIAPISNAGSGGVAGSNVSIGSVTVHTQATDANGIARDINDALSRAITDSNRGLE